ncbi:MAG: cytochrome c [Pseudomonadota bacterium]
MNTLMKPAMVCAAFIALAMSPAARTADMSAVVTIDLPGETAELKPGPGREAALANCMICHSVDYIYMQPPQTRDQWKASVVKMQKTFGAPIKDEDIDAIVGYLMSQNGKQ